MYCYNFKNLLFLAANQSIPKTTIRLNRKRATWPSDDTFKMIKRKRRAFLQYTQLPQHILRYKKFWNAVRMLTKRDHDQHLNQLTSNLALNPKRFWNWIKSKKGGTSPIPELVHNNQIFRLMADKVKILNDYFISVFTKESSHGLNSLTNSLEQTRSTSSIDALQLSELDVFRALKTIDPTKSSGPDEIPGKLLMQGADHLAKPLAILFNLSLKTATLPSDWKKANITPIFKKGSKHSPANYRPTSLTSIVIKTLERLIHFKVLDFLSEHNKLSNSQHGFRPGHSCQTQLLEAAHKWAENIDHA